MDEPALQLNEPIDAWQRERLVVYQGRATPGTDRAPLESSHRDYWDCWTPEVHYP